MASCRDIVNGALRKAGKLGAGRDARQVDMQDTFSALKGMYRALIAQGTFGRLADVVPTGLRYAAGENQRIFRRNPLMVVDLPAVIAAGADPLPYDQERVRPEGDVSGQRPPRDGAVVVLIDETTGNVEEWIFDGHAKTWAAIHMIEEDDQAPFSIADPEGLKCYLAARIVDDYGGEIGPFTARMAAQFLSSLSMRLSSPARQVAGTFF